ncbi:MAG TPA: DUF1684 domain-containing protein [Actinomycetota bacterium]|nr:DUF1684 domain-containing protein [Actinomycetota bacterium]
MTKDALDLLDWKRRIFELYAYVREAPPDAAWRAWRDERQHLFATHPQTPDADARPEYFDYDPAVRVLGELRDAPPKELRLPVSRDEEIEAERVGRVAFQLYGRDAALDAFWICGYGGGLFLPFRDLTSGTTTYGSGRYLYDTIKGADLGAEDGKLVLDFNFAYNPSCAYDPRWACPLAPPGNVLDLAVEAGERAP